MKQNEHKGKSAHHGNGDARRIGPVTAMKAEYEILKVEVDRLKSEYLRSLAEFDNFRRRKDKETAEFQEFANEKLLSELVQVFDNFERALKAMNADNTGEAAARVENVRKGMALIYGQLKETLGRFGFTEFSCVGEPFDPYRCEAVSSVETGDKPANTVIEELGKGYAYKNKVLRPAMVIVAKTKSDAAKAESDKPQGESDA